MTASAPEPEGVVVASELSRSRPAAALHPDKEWSRPYPSASGYSRTSYSIVVKLCQAVEGLCLVSMEGLCLVSKRKG